MDRSVNKISLRRRVGLFGGSFDPVHKGHLAIARSAIRELGLDSVWFVPCRRNPLKTTRPVASDDDRLRMLELAVAGKTRLKVSDYEIRHRGLSYSYRTVRFFLKRLGKNTELFWIVGSDLAPELCRWKRWDWLKAHCRFACAARAGQKRHRLPAEVLCFKMKPVRIASSDIQRQIARGASARRELPAGVAVWIRRRKLYR